MGDPLTQLRDEHRLRQIQRARTRGPVILLAVLLVLGGVAAVAASAVKGGILGFALGGLLILAGVLWAISAQLLAEWDRAVVLRLGRFHALKGPGFFMIVPFIDSLMRTVDTRVRTTAFYSEAMLTKDTVPVGVDAVQFWHVWDAKKAVLEIESYYEAIVRAVQTALRDIVGVHTLAEMLAERERMNELLQGALQSKVEAWGISVPSIEIRDILIPDELKDALSKQAQAERERQARAILGQAEREIADKFVEASKGYQGNPVAIQLRAMNILYEGLRAGNSIMLVPSSVLDTMNLGGLVALGSQMAGGAKPQASETHTEVGTV